MSYPLLSLVESPPPGFTYCSTPKQNDISYLPFALFAASRESAEESLASLGQSACIIVTYEPELTWNQCGEKHYHLGIPPDLRLYLPVLISSYLDLVSSLMKSQEHDQCSSEMHRFSTDRRFRMLFESMTEGVALHRIINDGKGSPVNYRIIEVNRAYESLLGLKRENVLGKLATEAYAISSPPFLDKYTSVTSTGTSIEFETFFPPLNKYFSISAVPWGKNGFASIFFDITERKRAEESREQSFVFIENLLAQSPVGIRVFDGETGNCVQANKAAANIAGGTVEALLAQNFKNLQSWEEAGLTSLAELVLMDGEPRKVEAELFTSFGKHESVEYSLSRFTVEDKPHLMIIGRDITEEKRLEEENRRIEAQMLHVQKLESLGVLAGGIAHDFNNILMAILGNADLALMRLSPTSLACENIKNIEKASQRAAELARQMLAYSGKGQFVIESLDLNSVIQEMTNILDVSISKKVVLRYNFTPNLPCINADATQIRQIIMNLVINASEAIGDKSGIIAVTSGAVDCDRAYLSEMWLDDGLPEGLYVFVEISDTGCGMDKNTILKIFDPFFTTKFTGRGLGMAAVLGIVRSHRGAIKVYSEVGKGTTFKILLPVNRQSVRPFETVSIAGEFWRGQGQGTILLVDDEETIRALSKDLLMELGFRVLTAADGCEALDLFRFHKDEIVCVILDLTMPHMDGEQAFRELRRIKPNVKVIMSSGYNEQEVTQRFVGKGLAGFIQKPYNMSEISKKLRHILGSSLQANEVSSIQEEDECQREVL